MNEKCIVNMNKNVIHSAEHYTEVCQMPEIIEANHAQVKVITDYREFFDFDICDHCFPDLAGIQKSIKERKVGAASELEKS